MPRVEPTADLVSIVIPVYNKREHLAQCLDSVCAQTYHDIEIIVIDDGSTDDSREVYSRYREKDPRVVVVATENRGASAARNLGIGMARGEYLQFVDADDTIDPEMTQKLHEAIRADGADVCICGYYQVRGGEIIGETHPEARATLSVQEYFDLIDVYHLDPLCGSPCNRLFRAAIFADGDVRFLEGRTFAEDFCFNLAVMRKARSIAALRDTLYYYKLDVPASLSKVTKGNILSSWEQKKLLIPYMYGIMTELGVRQGREISSTIYFQLLAGSLFQRVKRLKDDPPEAILSWFRRDAAESEQFRLDQVDLRTRKERARKEGNHKRRQIDRALTRTLLFCVKHRLEGPYIRLLCAYYRR